MFTRREQLIYAILGAIALAATAAVWVIAGMP